MLDPFISIFGLYCVSLWVGTTKDISMGGHTIYASHDWLLNCTLFHGRTHHACLHRVGPSMEERAGGFEKFSCNFLLCACYDLCILSIGNL